MNNENVIYMKAVIPAAGEGLRIGGLTRYIPKPLLPIANHPIIEHLVHSFKLEGVTELIIVLGHLRYKIKETLGDGRRLGVKINYVVNENYKKGGIHSLLAVKDLIGEEDFILSPGDLFIHRKAISTLWSNHSNKKKCIMTVAVDNSSQKENGTLVFTTPDKKSFGRVYGIHKPVKKTGGIPKVCVSLLILNPSFIDYAEKAIESGYTRITDAMNMLIKDEGVVCFSDLSEIPGFFWFDVDNINILLQSNAYALKNEITLEDFHIPKGEKITGPFTSRYLQIDNDSQLFGPISLFGKCQIGARSLIFPYTSIRESNLGSDVRLSNSIVFENSKVPDYTTLKNAVVYSSRTFQSDFYEK